MKYLLRACAAVALLCATALPASAKIVSCNPSYCVDDLMIGIPSEALFMPIQATPASPATQNTITTTAPVTSETTISVGTIASQALQWVVAVFGAVLGTAGTALLMRMFKAAGLTISDAARARLQEMVINGLNISAKAAETSLAGKGTIAIKSAIVSDAVHYVQNHGADTLKQLGVDPNSNLAVDAIKARIETAIADPMTPTPAVLNPATPVVTKGA